MMLCCPVPGCSKKVNAILDVLLVLSMPDCMSRLSQPFLSGLISLVHNLHVKHFTSNTLCSVTVPQTEF